MDVFVDSLGGGGNELTDVTLDDNSGTDGSSTDVSCNGNDIVYSSQSTNIVSGVDNDGSDNVYEYDRLSGSNALVSVATDGTQPLNDEGQSFNIYATVSDDGQYVAFQTDATNLSSSILGYYGINGPNVYVRDVINQTTQSVSRNSTYAIGHVQEGPFISADGSAIVYVDGEGNPNNDCGELVSGVDNDNALIYTSETGF